MFLPEKNSSEELQLIARNDEHHEAMTGDSEFMAQVHERNEQANQLMNLNNAALTQAGNNAAQNAEVLVKHDKESEDWINKKWRPAMGWIYMLTCTCDFVHSVPNSMVNSTSRNKRFCNYTMATNQSTGRRIIPHRNGCCSWYCCLWSY